MNDTGNIPFWDLNPATLTVGFLCLVILVVLVLAFTGGNK
jgi:energy-coupling factor transporter transmembrane protein EcfT